MNRFGLLLLLWVVVGLAGGTPPEHRRTTRRARVDVVHPDLDMEHPAGPVVAPVAPHGLTLAVLRPAARTAAPHSRVVRERSGAPAASIPGEPAAVPAGSRAPPALG